LQRINPNKELSYQSWLSGPSQEREARQQHWYFADELQNVLQYYFGFVCKAQNGSKDSFDVKFHTSKIVTLFVKRDCADKQQPVILTHEESQASCLPQARLLRRLPQCEYFSISVFV